MKKFCSLALVLALLLGLSVSVFAAETANMNNTGSQEIVVSGIYEVGDESDVVYSVEITWENMLFTYKGESEKEWNPQTHKYEESSKASGWVGDGGTITVTNHSNAFITLNCGYAPVESFPDINMDFTYGLYDPNGVADSIVCSAEAGTAQNTTITVMPNGVLVNSVTDKTTLGNITLTIGDWEEPTIDDITLDHFTFTGTLERWKDVITDEDQTLADNASSTLGDAIAKYEDSQTRANKLAVLTAYIDFYKIMTDLTAKYGSNS